MLFISGSGTEYKVSHVDEMFQSRNRDAFHFRTANFKGWPSLSVVSISQSRCFSFQVILDIITILVLDKFQSRNRDAFHFRFRGGTFAGARPPVSISQSRCFSFQACLGFERYLSIGVEFQSRNRDAFHFRSIRWIQQP